MVGGGKGKDNVRTLNNTKSGNGTTSVTICFALHIRHIRRRLMDNHSFLLSATALIRVLEPRTG